MTASSALRRAGGGRPLRRPVSTGWFALRAALLIMLGLTLTFSLSGAASADPALDGSPVVIGPGPALPPPPPSLPGGHGPAKKSSSKGKHGQQTKPGHRRNGGGGPRETLDLHASCAPFSLTQTYAAWGPAVAYGLPVTVVYDASRCSTPDGSALDVSAEGTATVYAGPAATGVPLDTKPFTVTGTWRQPKNPEAWPPSWWACDVSFATYRWEIPGVYAFDVSARKGVWTLRVSSTGVASQDLTWSHDGCA